MADQNELSDISEPTRRALLGSAAIGASSLVAGCSGGGGGDGGDGGTPTGTGTSGQGTTTGGGGPTQTMTETELADVSGQTLTWYTAQPLKRLTWMGTTPVGGPTGDYFRPNFKMPYEATMQPAIRMDNHDLSEPVLEGYESVTKTPEELTVKIRDDWNWSNGDPVTAGDALALPLAFCVSAKVNADEGNEEIEEKYALNGFHARVTDYEIVDDKTFKFVSAGGEFETLKKEDIYPSITMTDGSGWGGIRQNVKMEPYTDWWEAIKADWEKAKGGDWTPDDWQIQTRFLPALLGDKGYDKDPKKSTYNQYWEKYYRKPENVVVTGAWTLDAINGTKSVDLKPNPEYYDADKVNFDKIKFVRRQSKRAHRAALKANSQDYYRGTVPSYIVNSFPGSIEERQVPANGGLGFAVDLQSDLLGDRKVRQAFIHAIDAKRISRSVHKTKFQSVAKPGAHAWGTTEMIGDEWAKNNLMDYGPRNLDRANQLMEEAGYTKSGGKWQDGEGNVVSLSIPTSDTTPTLEPIMANQLSQFGIDASLQTYSGSVFGEKKNNGEFSIWRSNRGLGFNQKAIGRLYVYLIVLKPWAKTLFRPFPKEQVNATSYADVGIIDPASPTNLGNYTLEAPPVGEPDGELQEISPPKWGIIAMGTNDPEIRKEAYRKLAWLYNWHMPVLPIAQGQTQHFLDTGHWHWPAADSNTWATVGNEPEDLLPYGKYVQANPDNPESGASVE